MAQENPESLADEFKITRHYIIFDGKAHDYDALLASDGRTKASTRRNISPAAWVHLRGPISSAVRVGVHCTQGTRLSWTPTRMKILAASSSFQLKRNAVPKVPNPNPVLSSASPLVSCQGRAGTYVLASATDSRKTAATSATAAASRTGAHVVATTCARDGAHECTTQTLESKYRDAYVLAQ